ncbi:MAG: glycosyltransferase family 2 protein [Candidatus Dormibacteria bacterium]
MAVVLITRNRVESLLHSLSRLQEESRAAEVIVVDNGSDDGTTEAVRRAHPGVRVLALDLNAGAAGRNVGVTAAGTPYVAFADDDSWWAPGALPRAADLLDGDSRLALIAGRILVGDEARTDPTCRLMERSPLSAGRPLPGPAVLGFIACGAVVRRRAFLDAGGFHDRYGVGGEETLLALDLVSRGWDLTYVDTVVAHHHPSASRDLTSRRRREIRNDIWTAWLRRPLGSAVETTATVMRDAGISPWPPLFDAIAGLPWVLRQRHVVPTRVEADIRLLDMYRDRDQVS